MSTYTMVGSYNLLTMKSTSCRSGSCELVTISVSHPYAKPINIDKIPQYRDIKTRYALQQCLTFPVRPEARENYPA